MKPDVVEPGTHVAPNAENPWPVAGPAKPAEGVEPLVMDRDNEHRVPRLDLLQKGAEAPVVAAAVPVTEGAPATAAPVAVAAGGPPVPKRKRWPVVAAVGVLLLVAAGAGAYYAFLKPKPVAKAPVVAASKTPVSTPSPTLKASVAATPTPTPAATPAPQTVTAPTTAPTADHPQTVTITSKSGLWLRSSASSASRNNIIGWMPDGAQVSVDSTGDFWWHGAYKGTSGYFASKYTQ